MSRHSIGWQWRSLEPAKCEPDENFPFGKAADMSMGAAEKCSVNVPYPAPGVGTWIIYCAKCEMSVGVTAAGRPDDPTKITFACKEPADAQS